MKILVIWEEIPESIRAYSMEVSETQWENYRKVHKKYINLENSEKEDEILNEISQRIENEELQDITYGPFEFNGQILICGFVC